MIFFNLFFNRVRQALQALRDVRSLSISISAFRVLRPLPRTPPSATLFSPPRPVVSLSRHLLATSRGACPTCILSRISKAIAVLGPLCPVHPAAMTDVAFVSDLWIAL